MIKIEICLYEWHKEKPKPGSIIMAWGYYDGPSMPSTIDLECSDDKLTVERMWVDPEDDSNTRPFKPGLAAPFDGYELKYFLDGGPVEDDDEFLWTYVEDIEDVEIPS